MNAPLHTPPADARLAASLLLLRDGERDDDGGRGPLEVLMLRRAERGDDMRSGVMVFPGGVVDARDRDAHGCCVGGPNDAAASALLGVAEGGLDYWVAAVRECFEEVGLLLARHDGDPPPASVLEPWRVRLAEGSVGVAEFCREQALKLDLDGLIYYSHWLTPPGMPKRFDTRFFVCAAPAGQVAVADLGEAVELLWIAPAEALKPERGFKLLPVQRQTLADLARHADTAAALAEARTRTAIRLTMPRVATTAKGRRPVLPHESAYAEIARLDPLGRGDAHADLLPGRAVRLSPRVIRVTAPNPGPMTGPGTNAYLVGEGESWTVIDPGPESEAHRDALLRAAADAGGRIDRIVVTHTHRDHSPGARALAAATGAPVWGRVADHPAGQDDGFAPGRVPAHGERVAIGPGTTLRVVHTPGHASNHLCWLLEEERLLFTGDHVMQGSTVVINPPDGDMSAYLRSLESLIATEDLEWLAPGHGFLVADPPAVMRALIAHRLAREAKVATGLARLAPCTIDALLPAVYDDVSPALHPVARRSLLAHLLKLRDDGRAAVDGDAADAASIWRHAG